MLLFKMFIIPGINADIASVTLNIEPYLDAIGSRYFAFD